MEKKLGFIGAGNMAKAMMGGILKNEILLPEDVIASDLYQPGLERTKEELGIAVTTDNQEVVKKAEVVVLSVKPQFYAAVIEEIREVVSEGQIIVTIAPGQTLEHLQELFGKPVKIVRTMPNTPALVGEGIYGMDVTKYADGYFYKWRTWKGIRKNVFRGSNFPKHLYSAGRIGRDCIRIQLSWFYPGISYSSGRRNSRTERWLSCS